MEGLTTAPGGSAAGTPSPSRAGADRKRGSLAGRGQAGARPAARSRLTTPLVRDDGVLRPASWQEALDRAAAGFADVKARYGSSALGLFSCSKATNETNYLAQKFARAVLDTNNIDSCNRT